MKKVYALEIFSMDYRNNPVISQFMLCDSPVSANQLLDAVMKEYSNKKTCKVIDRQDTVVYRINEPEVPGMKGEYDFYAGWFEKDVYTTKDLDDIFNHVNSIGKPNNEIGFELQ